MLTRVSVAVVVAVGVMIGCAAPPPPEPAVDVEAEAQAIRGLSAMWLEAARARNGDLIDSVLAPNATTIFDGKALEGLPAIQADREQEWASQPQGELDWTTTSVVVAASGDFAVERGYWTEQDMEDGEMDRGEYVTVWTKIDGEWKVLYDAGTELEDDTEDEISD